MLISCDFVLDLHCRYSFRNGQQCTTSVFQPRWKFGFDFSFLLENERGEKRDYFLGFIGRQGIFQHDLGENELVDRIDLTSSVRGEALE